MDKDKALKIVDGTGKDNLAPQPKRGLIKALYDTVEACGGANIKQIKQYLPAAIDNIAQVMRKGKLNRGLYHAVYQGYLIHDAKTGYWKVAPMSYYIARQEYCNELAERRLANPAAKSGPIKHPIYEPPCSPSNHYSLTLKISKRFLISAGVIALVVAAFAAGRLLV